MQSQFLAAINQLCDEKGISKDTIIDTVKAALRAAYRKDYGNREQNIDVELSENTSDIATIFLVKTVVKKVEDADKEMTVKDAKKYKKTAKVGDEIKIDVTPVGYGRIAAQAAKQVIIQRIQEAEREVMYDTFKDRENELINSLIHRVENNQVYINLEDKATTLLPPDQQIPGEKYYAGKRLKLYLEKVIKTSKGPQMLISRTHPNLVRQLMELEIPEIKAKLVEIKAIARDPGVRCKIAVTTSDPKIDPIGSCVGQKGVRVQNIMEELNGERIDIIEYSTDPEKYLKAALSPAKIAFIKLDEKRKHASVYVNPEQRPLAIGKKGQNVQLASNLAGYEIDILDIKDLEEKTITAENKKIADKKVIKELKDIPGLTPEIIEKLTKANLVQLEQLQGLSAKDLAEIEGIGLGNAEIIVKAVKETE